MKNVGEFELRNSTFNQKFNRDLIIKSVVSEKAPILFDVGAHTGQSIDYLTKLFPVATIYSFEPDPDTFAILSEKASNKNKLFNIALSNINGKANFFRNKISHTSGLYKINLTSKDSIKVQQEKSKQKSTYESEILYIIK